MSNDNPPLFRTWRNWYTFVLVVLIVQIVMYYWLTRAFS